MKIAVLNAFAGKEVAETELARRLELAAATLGWSANEVASSLDIKALAPDLVIALHFFTPKLTGYPTYGCLWNPPAFFEDEPRHLTSMLSYDGYLSSSPALESWLRSRLAGAVKDPLTIPFYASCPRTEYRAPDLERPTLMYAGTNWDGARWRELFEALDRQAWMEVYGPADRWTHLRSSYRGALPFDGTSLLEALHRAGVGLCLHHDRHRAAGVPSQRIFEIAAAGAVAICQEHPFVREAFGDAVLWLDDGLDAAGEARQIGEHLAWIRTHPAEARQLAARAHAIFVQRFALEELLRGLEAAHATMAAARGFVAPGRATRNGRPTVQYVVRTGARSRATLARALESLAAQSAPGVGAILVRWEDVELAPVLSAFRGRLPIVVVEGTRGALRSTHLWEGLRAVSADYFGVLDDDDALHMNHVSRLLSVLASTPDCTLAYSGAIRVWEGASPENGADHPEPAELVYGQPYDRAQLFALRNYITSNAFLGHRALLAQLPPDPQLPLLEDLFLLLSLSLHTPFAYSGDPTAEFYWRADGSDNCSPVRGVTPEWTARLDEVARLAWSGRLLRDDPSPRALRTYVEALGRRGVEIEDELRTWRSECAHRDRQLRAQADASARQIALLEDHVRLLREQIAGRDEVIRNMERSKGWRMVLLLRATRDRAREYVRRAGRAWPRGEGER